MSAALIAANKIQADIAGLTGTIGHRATTVGTTATEFVSSVIHGESGGLHYLFGDLPAPVADPIPSGTHPGPNGGAGHPGIIGAPIMRPMGQPPSPAVSPMPIPVVGGRPANLGLLPPTNNPGAVPVPGPSHEQIGHLFAY